MKIFKKIKEWLCGANNNQTDEHCFESKGGGNLTVIETNRLDNPYLPSQIAEKALADLDEWRLVIFDKVSHVAYELDIDHLRLFNKQVLEQFKDDPDLVYVDSFLKTVEMGMSRKDYHEEHPWFSFCFLTKQHDQRVSLSLCKYFKYLQVPPDKWFAYYDVTIPQIRHSRVSTYKAVDRVYVPTLDVIFDLQKPHEMVSCLDQPNVKFKIETIKNLHKQIKKQLGNKTIVSNINTTGFKRVDNNGEFVYWLYTQSDVVIDQLKREIGSILGRIPNANVYILVPNNILVDKLG